MKRLLSLLRLHETKIFSLCIYVFVVFSILAPILTIIDPNLGGMKRDILFAMVIASIAIVFSLVRNLSDGKSPGFLTPYTSTATNLSDIEKKLETYRDCQLFVLGNSLTTMWNSLLKHYLKRIHNSETHTNLRVTFLKRVDDVDSFEISTDPVISQIKEWCDGKKMSASVDVLIFSEPVYFTGICANGDYLKFRLLNPVTNKDLIGEASQGPNEIQNRLVDWFCSSFNDLRVRSKSVYKYSGFGEVEK